MNLCLEDFAVWQTNAHARPSSEPFHEVAARTSRNKPRKEFYEKNNMRFLFCCDSVFERNDSRAGPAS